MLTNSVLRACVAGRQAGAAELAVADLPSGMDCRLVGHIPLHAETLGRVPLLFRGSDTPCGATRYLIWSSNGLRASSSSRAPGAARIWLRAKSTTCGRVRGSIWRSASSSAFQAR